jgi:hypothetical protein
LEFVFWDLKARNSFLNIPLQAIRIYLSILSTSFHRSIYFPKSPNDPHRQLVLDICLIFLEEIKGNSYLSALLGRNIFKKPNSFKVYVFNNSCSILRTIMKKHIRYKIISSVIMILLSMTIVAQSQSHRLPEPQKISESGSGEPPPPGLILPIDKNLGALATAGFALGIYFLRIRKLA